MVKCFSIFTGDSKELGFTFYSTISNSFIRFNKKQVWTDFEDFSKDYKLGTGTCLYNYEVKYKERKK